jgi:hypothetical protein
MERRKDGGMTAWKNRNRSEGWLQRRVIPLNGRTNEEVSVCHKWIDKYYSSGNCGLRN